MGFYNQMRHWIQISAQARRLIDSLKNATKSVLAVVMLDEAFEAGCNTRVV